MAFPYGGGNYGGGGGGGGGGGELASTTVNDSNVPGAFVDEALDYLEEQSSNIRSLRLDTGAGANDPVTKVYNNWTDLYTEADNLRNSGYIPEILFRGFGGLVTAGNWDLSGMVLRGLDVDNTYVQFADAAVVTGLPLIWDTIYLTTQGFGSGSGRTTPLIGTISSFTRTAFRGRGGIATFGYTGSVPFFADVAAGGTLVLFHDGPSGFVTDTTLGASEIFRLSSGSSQLDIYVTGGDTQWDLGCVDGTGSLYRITGQDGVRIEGTQRPGVVEVDLRNRGNWEELIGIPWIFQSDLAKITTPVTFSSGVRTQLTIDGLGPGSNTDFTQGKNLWDTTNNCLSSDRVGKTFTVRLDLLAQRLTSGSDELIVDVDIGTVGAPIVIAADTKTASVGGVQRYSFVFPLFSLNTFLANGAKFYLTPSGGDFEVSGVSVFIKEDR